MNFNNLLLSILFIVIFQAVNCQNSFVEKIIWNEDSVNFGHAKITPYKNDLFLMGNDRNLKIVLFKLN